MSNFPDSYEFRGIAVPGRTMVSLHGYIQHGLPTGGFLKAVLSNDLRGAVDSADDENGEALRAIVALLFNRAPALCWGNRDKYDRWVQMGGLEGYRKQQEQEKFLADLAAD